MKVYKPLDFSTVSSRIEPTVVDPYSVHLEDYESLNDLIARSIRCKQKFVPETDKNAFYDDFLDDEKLQQEDRLEKDEVKVEHSTKKVERSEDPLVDASTADISSPMP